MRPGDTQIRHAASAAHHSTVRHSSTHSVVKRGAAAFVAARWALSSAARSRLLRGFAAPRRPHHQTPGDFGLTACPLRIPATGGKTLFAWWVPTATRAALPSAAVLVIHGWGVNAAMMLPAMLPLHAAGMAVLLIDARCHGASDEEDFMSMPRFAEDIASGLDWLHQRPEVDATRLAVLGHSVGAAAALLCAARRRDVAAVVSLSAFAHPTALMRRMLTGRRVPWMPLGWALTRYVQHVIGARLDDIAPVTTLPALTCPVLLVHGVDDEVVPYADALRLQAASGGRAELLPVDAGHDLSDAVGPCAGRIVGFLTRTLHV